MKKILFLLFGLIFFMSFSFLGAECPGRCEYNNSCYSAGELADNKYCSFETLTFVAQKQINDSCMNDFECLSGYCIEDMCFDYNSIIQENRIMNEQAQNLSRYLEAGNCSSPAFCLNKSGLLNAHNVSKLCIGENFGYTCFECNEDFPYWNGSSCNIKLCGDFSRSAGCHNKSSLANAERVNGYCEINKRCFQCDSGYSWNGSICKKTGENQAGYDSSWISSYIVTAEQLNSGFTKLIGIREKIIFYLRGEIYYFGFISFNNADKTARINASWGVSFITLNKDIERKFDLDSDSVLDISLKLNNIQNSKINFTLMSLRASDNDIINTDSDGGEESNNLWKILFYAIIILIIILILIVTAVYFKSHSESHSSSEFGQQNNQFYNN